MGRHATIMSGQALRDDPSCQLVFGRYTSSYIDQQSLGGLKLNSSLKC